MKHSCTHVRGIRGAITIKNDTSQEICAATQQLLCEIVGRNSISVEDICSVLFSVTPDVRTAFPALFARSMGWVDVAMLHFTEIEVKGSLPRCIRVLLHVNTHLKSSEVEHVYLEGAVVLRPDRLNVPR